MCARARRGGGRGSRDPAAGRGREGAGEGGGGGSVALHTYLGAVGVGDGGWRAVHAREVQGGALNHPRGARRRRDGSRQPGGGRAVGVGQLHGNALPIACGAETGDVGANGRDVWPLHRDAHAKLDLCQRDGVSVMI